MASCGRDLLDHHRHMQTHNFNHNLCTTTGSTAGREALPLSLSALQLLKI